MSWQGPPPDRLTELERRIAALEQAQSSGATPESLSPNYLTVNPDGTIGALFTGGVQMLEEVVLGSEGAVTWTDPTGHISERVDGQINGGLHQIIVESAAPNSGGSNFAELVANTSEGVLAGGSWIQALALASGDPGAINIVLDSLGRSSFLQIANPGTPRAIGIDTGLVTVGWAGGVLSNNVTASHNLGRIPLVVLATTFTAASSSDIAYWNTFTYTSTTFGINGNKTQPTNVSSSAVWVAIG